MLERVGEGGQPLQPIRRRQRKPGDRNPDGHQQDGEVPERGADGPQQPDQDEQETQRRPEIGLEHDERAHQQETRDQRHEQVPGARQGSELKLAGEQVGAPEQDADLGELRGLQLQGAERDPAPRVIDLSPDTGYENREQGGERDQQCRVGQQPVGPGWQSDGEPEDRYPQHQEFDLFLDL
jgi:hypothetical protein